MASIFALRLVVLNMPPDSKGELVTLLARSGKVYFDVAMNEAVGGVAKLAERVGRGARPPGDARPTLRPGIRGAQAEGVGPEGGELAKVQSGNAAELSQAALPP